MGAGRRRRRRRRPSRSALEAMTSAVGVSHDSASPRAGATAGAGAGAVLLASAPILPHLQALVVEPVVAHVQPPQLAAPPGGGDRLRQRHRPAVAHGARAERDAAERREDLRVGGSGWRGGGCKWVDVGGGSPAMGRGAACYYCRRPAVALAPISQSSRDWLLQVAYEGSPRRHRRRRRARRPRPIGGECSRVG